MGQPVIHIEIFARNHAALADWYERMFGWTKVDFPDVRYSTGTWTENEPGAGFNDAANGMREGMILPYIYTGDIDADLAKVAANGASEIGEIVEIPGIGRMAQFRDPDGNTIALLQPVAGGM